MSQYYDSENISESKLSFRRATTVPQGYIKVLYGMDWCVTLHRLLPNSVNRGTWVSGTPHAYRMSAM